MLATSNIVSIGKFIIAVQLSCLLMMCLCLRLIYCRLIGKVAADHSHKWVFQEAQEHEINLISSWSNPADSVSISHRPDQITPKLSIASLVWSLLFVCTSQYPRTWEAQFKSGIKVEPVSSSLESQRPPEPHLCDHDQSWPDLAALLLSLPSLQTIALIAVREGVVQLGSMNKVHRKLGRYTVLHPLHSTPLSRCALQRDC